MGAVRCAGESKMLPTSLGAWSPAERLCGTPHGCVPGLSVAKNLHRARMRSGIAAVGVGML